MKNKAVLLVLVLVVVAAAAATTLRNSGSEGPQDRPQAQDAATKTFDGGDFGFSFTYPSGYVAERREVGSPARNRTVITLYTAEDHARLQLAEMGEGPTAITFDVFQNNLDKQTLAGFVTGSNDSNYKLPPDDPYSTTTVAGKEALRYEWWGLYNGESYVFEHNGNIIMASVTYLTPQDRMRADFTAILGTLAFSEPEELSEEEAVSYVKNMIPGLSEYVSGQGLPPRRVVPERASDGWYISFETHGSGVPYMLEAVCYRVTDDRQVTKTGEYKHEGEGTEAVSPRTCSPMSGS